MPGSRIPNRNIYISLWTSIVSIVMTLTKSLMPTQEQEPMREKIKKYLWVVHLNVILFFVTQQRVSCFFWGVYQFINYGIPNSFLLVFFILTLLIPPFIIAICVILLKEYSNPSERIKHVCIVLSCWFLTIFIGDMTIILNFGLGFRVIHGEIVIMLRPDATSG